MPTYRLKWSRNDSIFFDKTFKFLYNYYVDVSGIGRPPPKASARGGSGG